MIGKLPWLAVDLHQKLNIDMDTLEKACYFVLGCNNLVICVDHKPLLKILSDRSLNIIPNPQLCKSLERKHYHTDS